MIKEICLLISVMTLLVDTSESTNIKCNYKTYTYEVVGNIYYCWIDNSINILTLKAAHIDNATGDHYSKKDNSDINGIYVDNGALHYFPNGLEKIYFDLKLIYILNSKLKEVHQSDLKPFSKLKTLNLRSNQIEIIEEDLFEFNNELESIKLSYNKIYHIHPGVFDNLISLKYLKLKGNKCVSRNVENDAQECRDLIEDINKKCLSFEYQLLSEKVKVLEIATLILNSGAYNAKLKELEEKVKKSRFSHFKSFQNVFQIAKNDQKPTVASLTKPEELDLATEMSVF